MMRAQLHQVIERCRTAIRPMLDMMTVQVPGRAAAGETATLIAGGQRAFQCRRNGACLATDVQRLAFGIFDDAHNARVTSQTASGVRGEIGAVMQMAATVTVKVDQRFRGNVYLHLGVGLAISCINASARSTHREVS